MVCSALKGRIGNNMFQIAAGISLARKENTEFFAYAHKFTLPEPDLCSLSEYLNQFKATILRNIKFIDEFPEDSFIYNEPAFNYIPIEYRDDILLEGYFQSEKYFDKELVRETFSIDNETLSYINQKYGEILSREITSINVRRGDFTSIPEYHPVCSMTFFRNAIRYIGKDKFFLIISDDLKWCKKQFRGDNYFFVENEIPAVDLYLQTLCTNNIISNSTFSWWSAWLNNNPHKIVIAPSLNWTGKYHPFQDTSDLLPEEWIQLPNPLDYKIRIRVFISGIIRHLVLIKKRFINGAVKNNG